MRRMVTKQQLQSMDPYEFEELVAELWDSKGYTTNVRKKSGDKAVDIDAERGGRKEVIQVKRYSDGNKIGSEVVRKYATLYQQTDANKVVLVTSGIFTDSARELGVDLGVELIDGNKLINELVSNDINVPSVSSTDDNYDGFVSNESDENSTTQGSKKGDSGGFLLNSIAGVTTGGILFVIVLVVGNAIIWVLEQFVEPLLSESIANWVVGIPSLLILVALPIAFLAGFYAGYTG